MRQALISTVIISSSEDGGAHLARIVEETGTAACDTGLPDNESIDEFLRRYEIIIMECALPPLNLADLNKPLLFVGKFNEKWVPRLKNLSLPFGILPPHPGPDMITAALLSLKEGLFVFARDYSESGTTAPHIGLYLRRQREKPAAHTGNGPAAGGPGLLSERESAVLDFFSRGYSNRDIAVYLLISINTVKYHTASLYSKLGVSTRAEAVSEGIRRGLISI